MMFWYGAGWLWWQVALMWVGMLAFWALLIWAVWALVTTATRRPPRRDNGGDARQILDQRLARGEIGAEEYQRLHDLIASGDHQAAARAGDGTSTPAGTGGRG